MRPALIVSVTIREKPKAIDGGHEVRGLRQRGSSVPRRWLTASSTGHRVIGSG